MKNGSIPGGERDKLPVTRSPLLTFFIQIERSINTPRKGYFVVRTTAP